MTHSQLVGYSHRRVNLVRVGIVTQVMVEAIRNRLRKEIPIKGSTPSRKLAISGSTTKTMGAAPAKAKIAILYLGGGTNAACPGRRNQVSIPVRESLVGGSIHRS